MHALRKLCAIHYMEMGEVKMYEHSSKPLWHSAPCTSLQRPSESDAKSVHRCGLWKWIIKACTYVNVSDVLVSVGFSGEKSARLRAFCLPVTFKPYAQAQQRMSESNCHGLLCLIYLT